MRVATFYESRLWRNDGPPLFWTNAMRNMEIEVTHLSSRRLPTDEFDHHLWVDWGEDTLTGALPYPPVDVSPLDNTIYIASDTHLGFEYRVKKAEEFSKVYVNQKEAVEQFADRGITAYWLPHAVEPQAYPDVPIAIKKYDVCFVGYVSFLKRAKFLDEIFSAFPNFYFAKIFPNFVYGGSGDDIATIFRKSRIVLNTSATDDINMRFFEGWATGSFMLSEWVPSFADLRPPVDIELITYKDASDAKEKIRYHLENTDRIEISRVMKEWILKNHTYQERVKQVFRLQEKEEESGKEDCARVS